MAGVNNNQNTQQPRKKPITIGGYPEAVHDLMRAKYPDYDQVMNGGNGGAAWVNGGTGVNFFGNGGGATGKFEAQPVQTGSAPITDFTQMPKQEEFVPQGSGNANPALGPVQTPYMGDAAENTPQPQSNFEGMPQPSTGWNADGTPRYDTLSTALSGFQMPQEQQVPEFEADPKQRDGGFFSWLGKVMPKSRPGMREGETPDEYDRRITTNRENIAAFADAIRHMGNIINTSKGAPLQVFNDPTAMMEQGYQNRKAQRQKQAALDADAAYKQANLDLDNRKAQADQVYKEYLMGLRGEGNQLAKDKFEYQKGKDQRDFAYNAGQDEIENQIKLWDRELKEKGFNEKKRHDLIIEAIARYRANKSGSGGGRSGGGGSSAQKYTTWDANGKPHYAPNKTMYEFNEAYYNGNTSGNSSTSSSKEVLHTDGSTTKTTNRQSGSSVAQRAGKLRRQREEARKRASKPTSKKTNKKGGWASGLKF
ncbi:hypothetical protein [Segatella copri]|uniref:Uncharacterized protein n=1 Tax=Segatella copri TaxID=165179 RepID=A0AAW4MW63_9BACT|nr:hypothetical protein [Segatella copri]MBV3386837.1 hypothetical protein [Segatella copri]MBV3394674.1 hypothetical protein [Segatella copri]MBV3405236.1 hypothetical protein [Segatella copri]